MAKKNMSTYHRLVLFLLVLFSWAQATAARSPKPIGPFDGVESIAIDFVLGDGLGLSSSPRTNLHDLIPGGSNVIEKILHDQLLEQLGNCGIKVSQEAGDTLMIRVWGRPIVDVPTHSIFLVGIDSCLDETNPAIPECIGLRSTIHSAPNEQLTARIAETVRDMIANNTRSLQCGE